MKKLLLFFLVIGGLLYYINKEDVSVDDEALDEVESLSHTNKKTNNNKNNISGQIFEKNKISREKIQKNNHPINNDLNRRQMVDPNIDNYNDNNTYSQDDYDRNRANEDTVLENDANAMPANEESVNNHDNPNDQPSFDVGNTPQTPVFNTETSEFENNNSDSN